MKSFELVQNVLSVLVMALFGVIIGLAMVPSYLLFIELIILVDSVQLPLRRALIPQDVIHHALKVRLRTPFFIPRPSPSQPSNIFLFDVRIT